MDGPNVQQAGGATVRHYRK